MVQQLTYDIRPRLKEILQKNTKLNTPGGFYLRGLFNVKRAHDISKIVVLNFF